MKKIVLVLVSILSIVMADAQLHLQKATAMPAKKLSKFSKDFSTQGIAAACDTLKIDSARNMWSSFYYTNGTEGYNFGVSNNDQSGFNVDQDANYYDVSDSDYNYITGGLVDFQFANSTDTADLSKDLIFDVYDDAGGVPGNLLGTTTVKLSVAKADVDNSKLTKFVFTTPIQIPSNKIFYVSLDHSNFIWNETTKDSIAIVADSNRQANASAFQYIDLNPGLQWFPVNSIYTDNAGDSLNVNLFIFPYVSNSINGCQAILPVSILNFNGNIKDSKAYLTWNTAAELNNKGFNIERSRDGKNFTDLGFVKGAGTSAKLNTYSYTDATLSDLSNTAYYRLKQTDFDGKITYSKVIALSLGNIADWKMYPNPFKDKLTVDFNLLADSKVSVQIISKDGKLVMNADKGTLLQGPSAIIFQHTKS